MEPHCKNARPISWKLNGLQGIASIDWSDECISGNDLCHVAGRLNIKQGSCAWEEIPCKTVGRSRNVREASPACRHSALKGFSRRAAPKQQGHFDMKVFDLAFNMITSPGVSTFCQLLAKNRARDYHSQPTSDTRKDCGVNNLLLLNSFQQGTHALCCEPL